MMLNLNNTPVDESTREFELIPHGTVVRAIISLKPGDMEIPEFGRGNWFKKSVNTGAKWAQLELTVFGGPYDRRKVWDNIFVDGDKMGQSGIPVAKEIGLRTLRSIIESHNNLDPADMSEAAQSKRQISGIDQLNGMEICAKVKVEKGTNGYADQNKILIVLTPNSKDFISGGAAPITSQAPQPQATASGPVPDWAR
jgi:hypothetical protein